MTNKYEAKSICCVTTQKISFYEAKSIYKFANYWA